MQMSFSHIIYTKNVSKNAVLKSSNVIFWDSPRVCTRSISVNHCRRHAKAVDGRKARVLASTPEYARVFARRPYQQQCPSNIVECYKLNDSFDNVECCFDIVAVFGNNVAGLGNNVEQNFVLSTKSKQTEVL